MLKKPERLALQQRAEAALQTSTSWGRWVNVMCRQDEDGNWRTLICFTIDGNPDEVRVTPEALEALEDTISPRLFA